MRLVSRSDSVKDGAAAGAGLAVSTLSGKLIVLKPLLSHPQVRGSIQ